MRIALDATYSVDPHPSGIAVYSRELLAGLARRHGRDRFIHCYRLKQRMRATAFDAPNVSSAVLIPPVRTFRADIFHALNQRVDRRYATHVVCTFHDLFVITAEYSSADFRRRFTEQAKTAARHADIVIAVSEFTARQVAELLQFPREQIRVIPHGVHLPPERAPQPRAKMILFLGAIQKRKNLVRLIRAFSALPDCWRLVLAGSPQGFGAAEVLDAVEHSPARDRIDIPGYISEARRAELLSSAAVFAFPSLDEGFGMPVLEAMANGIPVLTSNRSGTAEAAGDAALLVDPFSEDEIAAGLRTIAADAELRNNLAARGRLRAAEFSWDVAVRRTYEVYRELSGDLLRSKSSAPAKTSDPAK